MINPGRFDLVTLRVFVAVVDAGSLTGGAGRFGMSLAAASKRMAELERGTGTRLLERSKKGVAMTPAGQTLYRHALTLVADLENLAVAMGDYSAGVRAHVRLWANTSAVNGFLPQRLAAFLAQHKTTRIDLEEALSDAIVRAVATGAADLGIFATNTPTAGLETILCDVDDLVVLLPARHPLSARRALRFDEIVDHDFIGLERSSSLLRLLGSAAEVQDKPLKVRVQVRSFDAMCRMISFGIGIGILPRSAASPHVASMRLAQVRLREDWARRELVLGFRDRASLSPSAAALARVLLEGRSGLDDFERRPTSSP